MSGRSSDWLKIKTEVGRIEMEGRSERWAWLTKRGRRVGGYQLGQRPKPGGYKQQKMDWCSSIFLGLDFLIRADRAPRAVGEVKST